MSDERWHIRIALWSRRFLSLKAMRHAIAGPEGFTIRDWIVLLQQVRKEARDDNLGMIAAGIAFWSILSVVPLVVGIIAACSLVATPAQILSQLKPLTDVLPTHVATVLTDQVSDAARMSGQGLTAGLAISLLGVLWTCSRAVQALISGLHIVMDEQETRSAIRRRATAFVLSAGAIGTVLTALLLVAAVPLPFQKEEDIGQVFAFGVRWLLLALLALVGLILLYRYGPDRKDTDWHAVRWGAGIAMSVWLLISAGMTIYMRNSENGNATSGTLAGVAAMATWFYLSTQVILYGAEINAELERDLARKAALSDAPPEESTESTGTGGTDAGKTGTRPAAGPTGTDDADDADAADAAAGSAVPA